MSMTPLTLHGTALCEIDNTRFVIGGEFVPDYCHLLLFQYYQGFICIHGQQLTDSSISAEDTSLGGVELQR